MHILFGRPILIVLNVGSAIAWPTDDVGVGVAHIPKELVCHLLRPALLTQVTRRLPHGVDGGARAQRTHLLLAQILAQELSDRPGEDIPFMTSKQRD